MKNLLLATILLLLFTNMQCNKPNKLETPIETPPFSIGIHFTLIDKDSNSIYKFPSVKGTNFNPDSFFCISKNYDTLISTLFAKNKLGITSPISNISILDTNQSFFIGVLDKKAKRKEKNLYFFYFRKDIVDTLICDYSNESNGEFKYNSQKINYYNGDNKENFKGQFLIIKK